MSSSHTDSQGSATLVAVTMPQMGVSVAEGTVTEWRKQVGDQIAADETICEVTTDKIDVEIPAPASGVVARIMTEPGETVDVGTPMAEIDTGGGAVAEPDAGGGESAPARPAAPAASSGNGELDRSGFYSPVVRRIAAEHGVDLAQVEGHGIGGRIRKRDLLAFIESGASDAEAPQGRPLHTESPYRPDPVPANGNGHAPAPDPAPAAPPAAPAAPAASGLEELFGPTRRESLPAMRRSIAKHMTESLRTSAHCTTIVEADFAAVAKGRAERVELMKRRGVNLTYLAYVARATIEALERFPALNASIDGDEIVYHDDVNLGIAVAIDDGLLVPVIRKAQRLGLEGIAAAITDLAERARSGALDPDELHGGTFTITNPGRFGAIAATPIINQPQVAILDLEAVVKRVVVREGPDGEDAIAIRPMANLCMSWDHRALDGAEAARFLAEVTAAIEEART